MEVQGIKIDYNLVSFRNHRARSRVDLEVALKQSQQRLGFCFLMVKDRSGTYGARTKE